MTSTTAHNLLVTALRDPAAMAGWDETVWKALLSVARNEGLLARLYTTLEEQGLISKLPGKVRTLLDESRCACARNHTDLRFEVNRLTRALAQLQVPIILLKGGAYVVADLPPARGRFASDLDILVPETRIEAVEQALLAAGWERAQLEHYDEHYYRDWMHEIPPLWHPDRLLVIDLHHTIVPRTARVTPNAKALLEAAIPLEDPRLRVLCPTDMVLHSAVHLFNEEMRHGLRDLVDLHDLLTHFGKDSRFWADLQVRADLHNLERTLFYLLRYSERLLATEIPESAREQAARRGAPSAVLRPIMDQLMIRALNPLPPGRPQPARALALWLLYVRSHWLKMPPLLLVRHLVVKGLRRWGGRFPPADRKAPANP